MREWLAIMHYWAWNLCMNLFHLASHVMNLFLSSSKFLEGAQCKYVHIVLESLSVLTLVKTRKKSFIIILLMELGVGHQHKWGWKARWESLSCYCHNIMASFISLNQARVGKEELKGYDKLKVIIYFALTYYIQYNSMFFSLSKHFVNHWCDIYDLSLVNLIEIEMLDGIYLHAILFYIPLDLIRVANYSMCRWQVVEVALELDFKSASKWYN